MRLRAAGINPVDYKLRTDGTIGGSLPAVLGVDGAGVVEGTGPAVTRFRAGDEVYFVDGGFGPAPRHLPGGQDHRRALLARKPERLSFVEAAAAPLVTITAWEALRGRARVERGQRVLVQAGAGGVGHMSVQIARLAGARVAATVSPGPKTELASSLGRRAVHRLHPRGRGGEAVRLDRDGRRRRGPRHRRRQDLHRLLRARAPLRRPGIQRGERVGGRGDQGHARPEPAGLVRLDAGPSGIRLAATAGTPASDTRAGRGPPSTTPPSG